MTDGNNLFGKADQPAESDGLTYVGEGRKYATIDELDKAYANANQHMGTLENENKELRERLENMDKQGDAVAKVLEALKGNQTVQDTDDKDQSSDHRGVDEEKLKGIVSNLLKNESEETKKKANLDSVKNKLTELYGEKAREVYEAKGQALNVDLDSLSQSSPEAVLELFKTQSFNQSPAASNSSINTQSLGNGPTVNSHKYWDQQFKDGNISREEKFRQQHKSLMELGPEKYWS